MPESQPRANPVRPEHTQNIEPAKKSKPVNLMKRNSFVTNQSGRTLREVAVFSLNFRAPITKLLSVTLTILAASIFGARQAAAQTLEWAVSYNGIPASALEETEGVVADAGGNVFATGQSGSGTGSAICTMKLSPVGTIQWKVLE